MSCKESKPDDNIVDPTNPYFSMCQSIDNKGYAYINENSMADVIAISANQEQLLNYDGMVKIPGGKFQIGGVMREDVAAKEYGSQPRQDEFPNAVVKIDPLWVDVTEVTNAQFLRFVEETGYVTTAERPIDLEEIMAQLPEGTPPPDPELLKPASLVFESPKPNPRGQYGFQDWWVITQGANWRHPEGPGSSIKGRENYPVVHVSWYDAMAYARWAGKRLPTESEWEYIAQLGAKGSVFPWGDDLNEDNPSANFWQGDFPIVNDNSDGFIKLAPVKSFTPNDLGIYDMAGNVWEWCSDWYHAEYYKCLNNSDANNPQGPKLSYDPYLPAASQKVVRGGSFLCNDSYCAGYRIAARMKSSPDTGLEHTGFRCVRDEGRAEGGSQIKTQ